MLISVGVVRACEFIIGEARFGRLGYVQIGAKLSDVLRDIDTFKSKFGRPDQVLGEFHRALLTATERVLEHDDVLSDDYAYSMMFHPFSDWNPPTIWNTSHIKKLPKVRSVMYGTRHCFHSLRTVLSSQVHSRVRLLPARTRAVRTSV
jgi:hypothetical protein